MLGTFLCFHRNFLYLCNSSMAINSNNRVPNQNADWRFETKYLINLPTYFALKNAITPYLKPDFYTKNAPNQRYLVRSLYFDTRNFRFYIEKINGISDRIKFRIRTYGNHPVDQPDIRVEMKVRKGKLMEKYGSLITHIAYQQFMDKGKWEPLDDPVLMEFERYFHLWGLVPKTLVQYEREGFESRAIDNLRLTFDHEMRSFSTDELFPEVIYWRRHRESQVVLEIKHKNEVPYWMTKIIQNFHLKIIPNSKYTNSIEVASHEINFPY